MFPCGVGQGSRAGLDWVVGARVVGDGQGQGGVEVGGRSRCDAVWPGPGRQHRGGVSATVWRVQACRDGMARAACGEMSQHVVGWMVGFEVHGSALGMCWVVGRGMLCHVPGRRVIWTGTTRSGESVGDGDDRDLHCGGTGSRLCGVGTCLGEACRGGLGG
jgi:hypothetical protein